MPLVASPMADDGFAARFNDIAQTYDALRFVQVTASRLVERVAPDPGARVLDIATGSGWAATAAAARVGEDGRVLGIDLAPDLLAVARQKAAAAGLSRVEFQEGDAQRLDLDDGAFDVVLCASGLFFLPDMLAALREWCRVLRPGGRVAFTGFGRSFRQPMADLWSDRLRAFGVPPQPGNPATRLADPQTCRQLLTDAGFASPEVQTEQLGYHLPDADAWWREVTSSLNRLGLARLSPDQQQQFRAEHLHEVQGLATPDGIWVDVPVHFAHGHVD